MPAAPTNPAYLTAEQVAAEVGCHLSTVLRNFRAGALRGRKVGHGWRTTRVEMERWLTGESGQDARAEQPPLERKRAPTGAAGAAQHRPAPPPADAP